MAAPELLLAWQESFSRLLLGETRSTSTGFAIYRKEYLDKLEIFLSRYYPSLPLLMGKEVWLEKVAYPFIRDCPSLNWDIIDWVRGLPKWLLDQKETLPPLLIPLAQFEKLQIETQYSPSFNPSSPEQVSSALLEI